MRYLRHFILILAVFAACAPLQFENAGSPNRLEDDKYDCEVMLGYRGAPRMDSTSKEVADIIVNARDEMTRCMQRKGWRLAQQ